MYIQFSMGHMKGYSDCTSTNTYCACNRRVTEILRHFVLNHISRATSWNRPSLIASEITTEIHVIVFVRIIHVFGVVLLLCQRRRNANRWSFIFPSHNGTSIFMPTAIHFVNARFFLAMNATFNYLWICKCNMPHIVFLPVYFIA